MLADHGALRDEPPLRVLSVAEYACASLPRAVGTLRGAALEPIERTLPRVGAPVLVIRADGDRLSTLAWAQHLAGLAPDGRLARLPGLGHDAFCLNRRWTGSRAGSSGCLCRLFSRCTSAPADAPGGGARRAVAAADAAARRSAWWP